MSERPVIAIVVVHPDDWAASMGATAWLLKDTHDFRVLCLSKGERGYKWTGEGSKPPSAELATRREAEERAACAMIGAEPVFMGQIDGEVHAERALCERVAGLLAEIDPVAVFTQWAVEVPDHMASYAVTVKAMAATGLLHSRDLYFMECGMGGQTNQFDPDLYVDITSAIDKKIEMARLHASQHSPEAWERFIRRQGEMRGWLARCDYAEPFKTYYPLVNRRWGRRTNHLLLNL
jgi:LmbE family N-acetylglucosaminyl deacetylase